MLSFDSNRTLLGQFYTAESIGELLVSRMRVRSGATIVDLGAGAGQLSRSAAMRWNPRALITVDVDPRIPCVGHVSHVHMRADALDLKLPDVINQRFDAAVCNPPYGIRPWKEEYADILAAAGMSKVVPVFKEVGLGVLFLAQTLRLTKPGAHIGLLVPDSFITGERCVPLREYLLRNHTIETVINLPTGAFIGTEARTHIVVIRKTRPRLGHTVYVADLSSSGRLSRGISVAPSEGVFRLDRAFHQCVRACGAAARPLRTLGAQIVRGSYGTASLKQSSVPIFHTSDFPGVGCQSVCLPSVPGLSDEKCVMPGDILIARVHRELEKKICIVKSGRMPYTDCIYRIRVQKKMREPVLESLKSTFGVNWLRANSRGVGARYITKSSLMSFPINI